MTIWPPAALTGAGPRYARLTDALAAAISAGQLRPGEKLPTHRDLADRLGVTVGTVSRAYSEAALRGLVSGEVGRGTFVRPPAVAPGPPDETGLVDLSANHPPQFEDPALRAEVERSLVALARRDDLLDVLDYPADGGNLRDREAGARWVSRTGLSARTDDVLVCSGSQHGITTVLATLLAPGDLLLTEELTFPGLKAVAGLLHLRLLGLPLDEHGLRPDAFEAACRQGGVKAVYVVPTLHNPTGNVMPETRRQEIARIAREHDVAIVEDDIHALLPEERPRPIAALAPERTYYLMSTSKILVPGLRVSYLVAPPGMFGRLAASLRATAWAAPPLMAALASTWIEGGTAEELLLDRRRAAARRQARVHERLGAAGLRFDAHPASYFVWLHLPEPWRSDTFAAEVRTRGLAVTPAEAFLVGRGAVPHAVRVCVGAARTEDELERGLGALVDALAGGREGAGAVV